MDDGGKEVIEVSVFDERIGDNALAEFGLSRRRMSRR
jgi:hypothetical protein